MVIVNKYGISCGFKIWYDIMNKFLFLFLNGKLIVVYIDEGIN